MARDLPILKRKNRKERLRLWRPQANRYSIWPISSTDRVALSEGVDRGSIPRWVTTSQRTALLSKPALCRFFHGLRRCSFPQKACAFQGPHGFAPSFFDVMIKWASEDSEWSAGDRKGFYAKFSYQTR